MVHVLGDSNFLTWVPLIVTVIVTILLVRSGTQQQLSQARKDTLELIKLRSDTIQAELDDCVNKRALAEQRAALLFEEGKHKDERVNELWSEVMTLRKENRDLKTQLGRLP